MNEQQRKRLAELIVELRVIAEPIGPLHGFWDLIFDIDAFLKGKKTLLTQTADEWIEYAEDSLKKSRRGHHD